jgi:hypothetical protein
MKIKVGDLFKYDNSGYCGIAVITKIDDYVTISWIYTKPREFTICKYTFENLSDQNYWNKLS